MRWVRTTFAAAAGAAAWACLEAAAGPPSDVVVKTSEHYRVTCHGLDAHVADASLEACEAAWHVVAGLVPDAPLLPHPNPLEVHVYRRFADYKAVVGARGYGALADEHVNLAFAGDLTAFVWFRPECPDEAMKRIGVPWGHRRRVAHEAAHLAFFERVRAGGFLPEWLNEGVAGYAEHHSIASIGFAPEIARNPTTGGWSAACRRMRRGGSLPSASDLMLDRLGPRPRWERAAAEWAFFTFLMDPARRPRLAAVLDAARPAATDAQARRERLFDVARRAFGPEAFDSLTDEFGAFVDGLAYEWDEWSGDLSVADARWIQTSDDGCAIAWREGGVGRADFAVDGSFEIQPGRQGTMAIVLLGLTDAAFVVVCFDGGNGVSVYDGRRGKTTADAAWTWMGGTKSPAPEIGVATRFVVRVADDAVHVKLAEKDVLTVPLKGRDMKGPWGVGVSAGALAIWDGVALR